MNLEHIVRFERGYDCIRFACINDDAACVPGAGGSHGKSGLKIRFLSKGDKGAVQFVLGTGWCPQFAAPDKIGFRHVEQWNNGQIYPFDLGCHSKSPRYEGQEPTLESCEWCDNGSCYYDGSGLNANDAMYALVNGGGDALWRFLDTYYQSVFFDADYPVPDEYLKEERTHQ